MPHPTGWLLVSDVDDTLLGDDEALLRLTEAWAAAPQLTIAYNSSRPCASLRETLAANPSLPLPDFLIGALGTEIQEGGSGKILTGYTQHLNQDWPRDQIAALMAEMKLTAHAAEYQTPLKASYDLFDAALYGQILSRLEAADLKVKVIYSGGKNLDIIPYQAGKGEVIKYLHRYLAIQPQQIVVAGDSGNDVEMFIAPCKGIIVGNADHDLKKMHGRHIYHAQAFYADGILEGLRFWQVL